MYCLFLVTSKENAEHDFGCSAQKRSLCANHSENIGLDKSVSYAINKIKQKGKNRKCHELRSLINLTFCIWALEKKK